MRFGTSIHVADYNECAKPKIQELGALFVRMDWDWAQASKVDSNIQDLYNLGFKPVMILDKWTIADIPNWTLAQWLVRLKEVLNRSSSEYVKRWEIWNEQNVPEHCSGYLYPPNPERYYEFLKATYLAIKLKYPLSVVVYGGIACTYPDWHIFLDQTHYYGALNYYNRFGIHLHAFEPEVNKAWVDAAHGIIEKYGTRKPTWVTEVGIYSYPCCWDETKQANYLEQTYNLIKDVVAAHVWYELLDGYTSSEDPEMNFGLVRYPACTKKPSYEKYKTIIQGTPQAPRPGEEDEL